MRVLLQNRHPVTWIGGDQVQLEATQAALMILGVEAKFSPDVEPDLTDYDLVHLFNLPAPWSYLQSLNAQRQGKTVILSTIYQVSDKAVPHSVQQQIVDYASKVICLSRGEIERMRRHLIVDGSKITIVPNGVGQSYRGNGVEPFELKNGREYVLCIGRIDDKNQIRLARICRDLNVPLVLVGEMRHPRFVADLAEVKHPQCLYLGPRSATDLISIYKGAKVVACVSNAEVFPSVVMEGGLAGCNIVLTKGSASMTDWPNVEVCDPDEPGSIAAAISKQLAKPRDGRLVEMLSEYTWERAGEQIMAAYEEALAMPQATTGRGWLSPLSLSPFHGFSQTQTEESFQLAVFLAAWSYLEKGDVSSARRSLESCFQVGMRGPLLSELLVASALAHVDQLGPITGAEAVWTEFVGNLLSAVSTLPDLESSALAELYAKLALRMSAAGHNRTAVRYALRAASHDRNWSQGRKLVRIVLERTVGPRMSDLYRSATLFLRHRETLDENDEADPW